MITSLLLFISELIPPEFIPVKLLLFIFILSPPLPIISLRVGSLLVPDKASSLSNLNLLNVEYRIIILKQNM